MYKKIFNYYFFQEAEIENWNSGYKALKKALKLETSVTKRIRELIKTCEHPNDINLVDYHVSYNIICFKFILF